MVESTPSRQRRPPCKTNKEESDEAADAAALTYLLTYWVIRAYTRVHKRLPRLPRSPAVGKVGKPRRGHPLVEFVLLVWI